MTACDMAAALPGATADGCTLLGWVGARPAGEGLAVYWAPPRDFAPGEAVRGPQAAVPQVRRTHGLLGVRPAGRWGLLCGVNEHGVAAAAAPTRTRLSGAGPGLAGPDVVRLALERAAGARQALDAAADLVARHGPGDAHDHALFITDKQEGFLLTTCGPHWAVQQVGRVRAANEVCCVRQDWDRLSRGLSDLAIARGWQAADGNKLDFAGALALPGPDDRAALRRWGQATLRLEQQYGVLGVGALRRLLGRLVEDAAGPATPAVGFVARTEPAGVAGPTAWLAFGPAEEHVYLPLVPEAEPPAAFGGEDCPAWRRLTQPRGAGGRADRRRALAALQSRLDQAAAEYAGEAAGLRRGGDAEGLRRLAGSFMQHNWERFEEVWEEVASGEPGASAPGERPRRLHLPSGG